MSARFEPAVEAVLRTAGWFPGRVLDDRQLAAFHREVRAAAGEFGGRLDSSYFAAPMLAEFGGLTVESDLPGVDLAPRPFTVDPGLASHSVETLIDVSRALGTDVYPLGVEGAGEAVLAVTDLGTVVAVDSVGEWLLGGTMDQALDLLISGRRPRLVEPADGRPPPQWLPRPPDPDRRELRGLGALKRPIGIAFYLPWSPANLHYVWLPEMLHRIGIEARPSPTSPKRFEVHDWGGLSWCEVHLLDLHSFTVLVIAFESREYLGLKRAGASPGRLAPGLPAAAPIVEAFCDACAALAPDLAPSFLVGLQQHDLLGFVAEQEQDVLLADDTALRNQIVDMLYLPDGYRWDSVPLDQGEVLSITGGQVLLLR